MEGEGDGRAVTGCLVYADACAELFGGVLYLPETMGNGTIEISACISDPDHRAVAIDDGLDGNTFLLGGMDDAVEQVPQYIGQHVLVDTKLQPTVNFIYDETSASHGQGKQADCKGVDEIVQTDLVIGTVQGIHILDFTLK